MIHIKSSREIGAMRRAGEITGQALMTARHVIEPGIATRQVAAAMQKVIRRSGAVPAFLGYNGFPGACCISINDEVIHGIPGRRILREGDIVSVDVGVIWNGYYGDAAATFPVGVVSVEAMKLIRVTRECFFQGLSLVQENRRISDISYAVQQHAEKSGFSVVRDWAGHGVGTRLHEEPEVPNYGDPGHGPRLLRGMTICVEPMINAGGSEVFIRPDGWTVVTVDGRWSSHYEHTILVTGGPPELLTAWEESA